MLYKLIVTSEPVQQARCSGVYHLLSFALTLAPCARSIAAIAESPLKAAACNGVLFSASVTYAIISCF